MAYRTVKIEWKPKNKHYWRIFTSSRIEAAKLWSDLVERHFRIRRSRKKWPTKYRWAKWAKGKYPNLHSQSVQQIIYEFCEAVESATQLRKTGHDAKYPWRKPKYHDVTYTNQGARIRNNNLLLPNGIAGTLSIRIPETINIQGDLVEVRLKFGYVLITYKIDDEVRQQNTIIGVDLGVNTLIAATDGEKAILVSGREAKTTVQWRNKKLASLQAKQAKKIKGSIRYKRIQNRKQKLLTKSKNRMNDIIHKATRKVANEFPSAKAFVGKPFNGAAQKMAPKQAQQVSSACNAKIIRQLDYKLFGAIEVNEAYTSQTCPVCGARQKVGRIYKCCNFAVPRDIIGSINILSIGLNGVIASGRDTPNTIKCVYPMKNILKYPVPPQVVPEDVGQVVQNI